MAQYRFQPSLRLQKKSEFTHVFDQVDKKFHINGLLILIKKNDQTHLRLGLVIAKKNLKFASDRNTVKRQIRESVRINQSLLAGLDIIVLAKRDIKQVDRKSLWQALNQFWPTVQAMRKKV